MKVGYARVSTEEQNLDLQLAALETAGCQIIFRDHGASGTATQRSGLRDALAKVSDGDVLIVWKLDRLGRSLGHLVGLLDELGKRHVGFASITEAIDTTTPGGRLVFHMMAALAEFERSIIIERTRAGMMAAKRRGQKLGRPAKLSPENIANVRRILSAGAITRRDLAAQLGVNQSTLSRALKR